MTLFHEYVSGSPLCTGSLHIDGPQQRHTADRVIRAFALILARYPCMRRISSLAYVHRLLMAPSDPPLATYALAQFRLSPLAGDSTFLQVDGLRFAGKQKPG